MNRHERRRQNAKARHNKFVGQYVQHLPELTAEQFSERFFGGEPGALFHVACYHEEWCSIYDKANGTLADCNCNPTVKYHEDPRRT
jgi:hypothetical protein